MIPFQMLMIIHWCRLSAPLHLRLLTALCNDTLEGGNMRAELASRVDQIAALHSERHHMQLEVCPLFKLLTAYLTAFLVLSGDPNEF